MVDRSRSRIVCASNGELHLVQSHPIHCGVSDDRLDGLGDGGHRVRPSEVGRLLGS